MDFQSFIFSRDDSSFNGGAREHYHNLFEIYYLENGSCDYFIDNKSYKVNKGDLVLIPEGIIHKTTYSSSNRTRLLINCHPALLPSSVAPHITSQMYVYRNHEISDAVHDIFSKIENEVNNPDDFSEDAKACLVKLLFYLVVRHKNEYTQKSISAYFIEEIIDKICKNYSQDITLKGIAKDFSISPEHLSRTFKKHTGFGFLEYVTIIRLREAERMLKENPHLSVSLVAYSCGFNDSNYFSHRFRKHYGCSPSQLKNKNEL